MTDDAPRFLDPDEMALPDPQPSNRETLRLLHGHVLNVYHRLEDLERIVTEQTFRLQKNEAYQLDYTRSVEDIRTHFDSELAGLKTVMEQINTTLRVDNGGDSLLAWRRNAERWMVQHTDLHLKQHERAWKISTEVLIKVILWALGVLVVMAASTRLGGKL